MHSSGVKREAVALFLPLFTPYASHFTSYPEFGIGPISGLCGEAGGVTVGAWAG